MDKIKLFQTERVWKSIRNQVLELVDDCHYSGAAQNSTLVNKLEKRLADQFNRRYCITTANCTDALTIACVALRLPENSKVGVSNYTFTATAHAIKKAGHIPVPLDVSHNYTIDIGKIPSDLDAIVAVDIFGNMNNWNKLNSLGIPIINDAAQSLESRDNSSWSVAYGLLSCISFSPSKTISCWGSGGAILTDSKELADLVKQLRLHGKATNNTTSIHPGYNSMLSSFEAACVWAGLDYQPQWHARRHKITEYIKQNSKYHCPLDDLPSHTNHKLIFQAHNRKEAVNNINKKGIVTAFHYNILINDEPLYRTYNNMLVSDRLKKISFTVPNQHTLTDAEVEKIAKALK